MSHGVVTTSPRRIMTRQDGDANWSKFGRVVDGFKSKLLSGCVASSPQCWSDVIGQIVARVLWGSFVDSVPLTLLS